MTTVANIMSADVQAVEPQETLRRAAQRMRDFDVGALPVCSGDLLLGMVTDRDIAVRGVAEGLDADSACVSDVMTPEVESCRADDDAQEVMRAMGARQVRRLPVVDEGRRLIGIVSLGDLALRQTDPIDGTVRDISEPAVAVKATP